MKEILNNLFERDLDRLKNEITAYKDENNLWLTPGEVNNSAGNLTLHLLGNLKHFVGSVLGNTDYARNRDDEFTTKNVSINILISGIDETKEMVLKAIDGMPTEKLDEDFPINVFGYKMKTGFFLVHLTTHLNYHLGQISYHRRILDSL